MNCFSKRTQLAALFLAAGTVTACASTTHSERADLLDKPIDCSEAPQDIADLEAALPSGFERTRSAFQSVTPVGLATGALKRENKDKIKVAAGRTGEEIEARILEIEQTCGTAEAEE